MTPSKATQQTKNLSAIFPKMSIHNLFNYYYQRESKLIKIKMIRMNYLCNLRRSWRVVGIFRCKKKFNQPNWKINNHLYKLLVQKNTIWMNFI